MKHYICPATGTMQDEDQIHAQSIDPLSMIECEVLDGIIAINIDVNNLHRLDLKDYKVAMMLISIALDLSKDSEDSEDESLEAAATYISKFVCEKMTGRKVAMQ